MKYFFTDNRHFIDALKNGDENAFAYLIKEYNRLLVGYIMSMKSDHALAEDIIQTTFLKVWKHRKRLDSESSIKSYLYKVAYNEFVNQYRRDKAMSTLELAYTEALNNAVDDHNLELLEQKIKLVNEGIDNLPPKCKQTFLLSKKEGLTNSEIAEHLNISPKTVEGHLTKAYHLLRQHTGVHLKAILFMLFDH